MKKITRAMLRDKPLLHRKHMLSNDWFDCNKAKITKYEWGKDDPRQFCSGLAREGSAGYCEECLKCRAFVFGELGDTPWDKDVEFNPKAKEVSNG